MSEADISAMIKENKALHEENRILRMKIDYLSRQMFGVKSEKLSPGQLEMMLCSMEASEKEAEASVEEPVTTEAPKKKTHPKSQRPRIPEHLPVEESVIDPDEVEADRSQRRFRRSSKIGA